MMFHSETRILRPVLIFLLFSSAVIAGPAGRRLASEKALPHVTSSHGLHQLVVDHSQQVANARSRVKQVLNHPQVREELKRLGGEPARLEQQIATLGDAEILELQSQIMPLAEQMETAAQDGGTRKKVLLWVLVVAVAALTIAMFMFYS